MNILIEKNVAIPEPRGNVAKTNKYPLAKMKINDSFSVKPPSVSRFQSLMHTTAKKLGNVKVATRSYPDGTVRVWRIA